MVDQITTTTDEGDTLTFDKNSWQATLVRSTTLFNKSANDRKRASALLWEGGKAAIDSWDTSTDAGAEGLYNEALTVMGKARKGDASKIKTVALAVKNHGLDTAVYDNLSKAYAEAVRLTKTVQAEADEDDAAEDAISKMDVPNTASTPENAAKIVLSKGVDEAARLLLDALGVDNEAAHRSLMRAISNEIAGRVKPAPKPAAASGPKAGATQATKGSAKAKASVKPAATKAKPVPVSKSQGDPNKKALPPKATATKAKPVAVKRPAAKPAK